MDDDGDEAEAGIVVEGEVGVAVDGCGEECGGVGAVALALAAVAPVVALFVVVGDNPALLVAAVLDTLEPISIPPFSPFPFPFTSAPCPSNRPCGSFALTPESGTGTPALEEPTEGANIGSDWD